MAFISSACANCAISGIDLLATHPYSSVPSLSCPPSFWKLLYLSLVSSLLFLYLFQPPPQFFFWPGRSSQCEIMVNAPWQSDTTHSPGPAPSGFNLIWSEKCVCVCVEVGRGGGGLGACWRGWRTRWKLGMLFFAKSSHHPSFFPNCPLPTSCNALTPPEKSKMIVVRSKVSKNMLKICKRTGCGFTH